MGLTYFQFVQIVTQALANKITSMTFSLFSGIHDKLKLFSINFAGDTAINKGKYLKRGIKSSLLSPSRPINQWNLHRTRHTNQQRGFGKIKISLPVLGDHLYISGYLPDR